jgi:hypothetical protein
MELTVYGTGFTADSMVTITYDDEAIAATATTNANGNFSAKFIVPPSVARAHTITATDGSDTKSSVFIMESAPPPMPVPLLPEVASIVEAEAYFDWGDVTDDSLPVSYTLQIASDPDFTASIREKEGLTGSEYTLTEAERLEPAGRETPYYWRVRAVDGAFNEGEWTYPILFYAGSSQASTLGWALYLWIGLGILLLAFFGFWMRRRITSR